jgi:hypothetical protein
MPTAFSINFDHRCPFARNANEHVIEALRAGAPWEVEFHAFSQSQGADESDRPPVWTDPLRFPELIAGAASIVVRDRIPDHFYDAHLSLFALRHDDAADLRDESVVRKGLIRAGVDDELVWREIERGWPLETYRAEHEAAIAKYRVFGVPTFTLGDQAVFVRLMHRPHGNAEVARDTIERVLGLLRDHPEINEYKHTTIPF